jgi:mRNA interferase RelE/StbE
MNYEVRVSDSASKEIKNLPKSDIGKVVSKIQSLSLNPRPSGCKKLIGTPEELWRIRSGNYRIIYSIKDKVKIVEIRRIGNRKDIYK